MSFLVARGIQEYYSGRLSGRMNWKASKRVYKKESCSRKNLPYFWVQILAHMTKEVVSYILFS